MIADEIRHEDNLMGNAQKLAGHLAIVLLRDVFDVVGQRGVAERAGGCGKNGDSRLVGENRTPSTRSLASFAAAYADQNAFDHVALVAALNPGRIKNAGGGSELSPLGLIRAD